MQHPLAGTVCSPPYSGTLSPACLPPPKSSPAAQHPTAGEQLQRRRRRRWPGRRVSGPPPSWRPPLPAALAARSCDVGQAQQYSAITSQAHGTGRTRHVLLRTLTALAPAAAGMPWRLWIRCQQAAGKTHRWGLCRTTMLAEWSEWRRTYTAPAAAAGRKAAHCSAGRLCCRQRVSSPQVTVWRIGRALSTNVQTFPAHTHTTASPQSRKPEWAWREGAAWATWRGTCSSSRDAQHRTKSRTPSCWHGCTVPTALRR